MTGFLQGQVVWAVFLRVGPLGEHASTQVVYHCSLAGEGHLVRHPSGDYLAVPGSQLFHTFQGALACMSLRPESIRIPPCT